MLGFSDGNELDLIENVVSENYNSKQHGYLINEDPYLKLLLNDMPCVEEKRKKNKAMNSS